MPAPTSPVDICNLALDFIGERANIASIETPENRNEVLLARHYDLARKSLLREHVWNFTRSEATLARVGDGGLDYSDKFLMPNDCLKLIKLGTYTFPIRDYNIQQRNILINLKLENPANVNTNALEIRYVKDITDVALFDPSFIQALALYIGMRVSFALTEKKGVVELLSNQLKQQLPDAVGANGQERRPRRINRSKWLDSRIYDSSLHTSYNGIYWVNVW